MNRNSQSYDKSSPSSLRDNSSLSPIKKPPLQMVYEFYTKQTYISGKHATFERLLQESTSLDLTKFLHFCRDFQIDNRDEMIEIFRKNATLQKHLTLQQFESALLSIAQRKKLSLEELYIVLELNNWNDARRKLKHFAKPFNMKEDRERIGKDEIKYQFKLYHPSVKDQDKLRSILEQRRHEKELVKSQEREKKKLEKMKHEYKYLSGSQLVQKYPDKVEIIRKIQHQQPKQHKSFFKAKGIYNNYYKKENSIQLEEKKPQIINWDNIQQLHANKELIQQLVGEGEDDTFLIEYSHQQKRKIEQAAEQYGRLSLKKRSMSDHNTSSFDHYQKINQSRERESQIQSTKRDKSLLQNITYKSSNSPNKLNIQVLKRAKEIQNVQSIRERNVYEQIIKNQKRKEQKLINQ